MIFDLGDSYTRNVDIDDVDATYTIACVNSLKAAAFHAQTLHILAQAAGHPKRTPPIACSVPYYSRWRFVASEPLPPRAPKGYYTPAYGRAIDGGIYS